MVRGSTRVNALYREWHFVTYLLPMVIRDDDGRPAGLCFISTSQVRMYKNTILDQR